MKSFVSRRGGFSGRSVVTVLLAAFPAAVLEPAGATTTPWRSLPQESAGGSLDAAMVRYFDAEDDAQRAAAIDEVLGSGAGFDDLLDRLRRGRTYRDDVPRGRLLRTRMGVDGRVHPYMILVPESYTPEKRWLVRFDLHGGMGAPEWKSDGAWAAGWRETCHQIVILPAGWWDSMWWEWSQVESCEAILAEVKRTWNIDENRVVMYGGSDGGAALFFWAMRRPDRWAGYAGHVAPPDRLVRANLRPDGQMHVCNLAGQRFHLGYGERDPKCPIQHIRNYMALFEEHGALLDWYVIERQAHQLTLSDEHEQNLGRFLFHTVRDPLPDRLTWATEGTDRYARRSWLVIDGLSGGEPAEGARRSRAPAAEHDLLPRWGTSIQLQGATVPRVAFGRVDLVRENNRVTATARDVRQFTLLLSPDEFDLDQPVEVIVNGQPLFHDRVPRSAATLLKWAAVDDDRAMLFAAELTLVVPTS